MSKSKYTSRLDKEFGDKLKDKSKPTLSKFFKIPIKLMDEVYDRGLAAARNTGTRPSVKSDDQWARARLYKFILNVVDAREGKNINRGAGQDGDIVYKALDNVLTLKKSKRENKKYVVSDGKKKIHFGDDRYRDFILMNDKNSKYYEPNKIEREKVKENYQKRHKGDNLDNPLSAGALSYFLLWNEPSLKQSIKDYEKRFKIKIKI